MSDTEPRTHFCTLCDRTWERIPDDAVQLTTGGAGKPITYRFNDGEVHAIKSKRIKELNNGIPNQG
jgi:hypothetical protein